MKNSKQKKIKLNFRILTISVLLISTSAIGQDLTYGEPKSEVRLNSEAEESLPLFNEETETIYTVRTFHQDNTGGKQSGNEIWAYSLNERKEWVRSEDDYSAINNKFSNAVVGVANGGKKLFLLNNYSAGGEMIPGISTTELKNHKWTTPKNVKLDWLDDNLKIYNVYVNPEETVMLLSTKSKGPDSSYTLMLSEHKAANWTAPQRLSEPIASTNSDEITPFLTDDGRYLYFSSNRGGGKGDFDIYRSEKGSNMLDWSKPVNIEMLNSSSFDAYYSESKVGNGYFVSSRKANLADIYSTVALSKMETKEAVVEEVEKPSGEVVSLHPNVNFEFDKSRLNQSAKDYLNKVVDSLKSNKDWDVTLAGHTDSIGSNQYNRNLAKARALSVRNYLITNGISSGRMDIDFYGERRPTATNETQFGRYQNRRVEITFIKP